MPIPQNITSKDIISGIERIKYVSYSGSRESDDYDLYYKGGKYPPKVVISNANITANGRELRPDEFHGGSETNEFLINRGFPIQQKDNRNPEDFFTIEELRFFDEYSGQPYNSKDDIHKNAAEYISEVIWEHSKHWADLITEKLPFKRSRRKTWNERQNNEFGQRFKPYSWYRLNHLDYSSKNVFYTVGVEGPFNGQSSRVVIKLDCYRAKLNYDAQDKFDNLLEERGVDWKIITSSELASMGWQELLAISTEYINNTLDTLIETIPLVDNNVETKYARITWNDNEWVKPSGRHGKSKNDSHEKKYGYGHEEWLFNVDRVIDGYIYSRLEPIHTEKDKHVGNVYDIYLYSHNQDENNWYRVGRISNVEVITQQQSKDISKEYKKRFWFKQQLAELSIHDDIAVDNFNKWPENDRFNIRFRPEEINIDLQLFPDTVTPPTNRYNLLSEFENYHLVKSIKAKNIITGLKLKDRKGRKSKKTINRCIQPHYSEIENIHGKIQDGFVKYLESHGRKVYPEGIREYDNKRIDIVEVRKNVEEKDEYIFYEIKSYPSVSHSIRVALGQLLEYAYYPTEKLTNEFVIVSHLEANKLELDYLKHISELLSLKISYICFDYKTNNIIHQ